MQIRLSVDTPTLIAMRLNFLVFELNDEHKKARIKVQFSSPNVRKRAFMRVPKPFVYSCLLRWISWLF